MLFLLRPGPGSDNGPGRLGEHADDFWAVRSRNAAWMLRAPKLDAAIIDDEAGVPSRLA